MTQLDHFILKVNDLEPSLEFYTGVMGFHFAGMDGPFAVIKVSECFQIQLAAFGTPGFEHYAFAVSELNFHEIFRRVQAANIDYGAAYDNVGSGTGPAMVTGARGEALTVYFNDPNQHLIEIKAYAFATD
ncbi:MAG: VOC family protein [Pseudomonadales bacterium]|nr:VOC family protein [Pseudomonadales bacterium]